MKIHKISSIVFAVLIVYAVFLPLTQHFDLSISLFVFSIFGGYYLISKKRIRGQKYIIIYCIFSFTLLFPLFYSSDVNQGLLYLIKNYFSISMLCFGIKIANSERKTEEILRYILIISIPLMVINIIFAFNATAEASFLDSSLAQYFVSPTSLMSWRTSNITDVNKSGTIFPNTNNASVFFSIMFAISIAVFFRTKGKKYLIIGVLSVGALLATGCRTGIIVLLLDFFLILFVANRKVAKRILYGFMILIVIALIIQFSNWTFLSNTLSRLNTVALKNDPRVVLWQFAFGRLSLFGYGFGGWEGLVKSLPAYFANFPPHNHLLVLEFIGGIAPVVLYILFWGSLIRYSFARYKKDRNEFALLLMMTCVSIVVHGLFDNYFLVQTNILQLSYFIVGLCTSKAL